MTIEPSGSRFADNFVWDGALSGNHLVGLQGMANITVNNVANLGGLTLGKTGNTSNITISAPTTVKGTIALMGHAVAINEALTAAGNATTANNLRDSLVRNLEELRRLKPDKLVRRRREKFLRMGQFTE